MRPENCSVCKVKIKHVKPRNTDLIMVIIFFVFAVLLVFVGTGCTKQQEAPSLVPDRHMQAEMALLQAQVEVLEQAMEEYNLEAATMQEDIDTMDLVLAHALAQVATLMGYQHIVAFVDPCTNAAGHDELLIKLDNGKYLAHFSHGNLQFLTELQENVQYVTTDGTSCAFKIVGGEIVY